MLPWLVFSFMAVIDFGLCIYGLIGAQDAARIGAVWGSANSTNANSSGFTSTACTYAKAELSVTTCGATGPLNVTTATSTVGGLPAVKVTVTYNVNLLGIPLIMPQSLSISRAVVLPIRN